jgi:hypothetical protein
VGRVAKNAAASMFVFQSSLQFVSFVECRPMAEIVVDYFWFGSHYRGPDTRPFPGVNSGLQAHSDRAPIVTQP